MVVNKMVSLPWLGFLEWSHILTISLCSWTRTSLPLRTNRSFFFPVSKRGHGGTAIVDVCWLVSVCARACDCVCVFRAMGGVGGSLFGLVWLSVYVCVHRCGSVRKNFSVISFPCFPKKHGWLAETF